MKLHEPHQASVMYDLDGRMPPYEPRNISTMSREKPWTVPINGPCIMGPFPARAGSGS